MPEGKDVGGTFKSMPVCRSAIQTGCVVAFATFRANAPPPSNARFIRSAAAVNRLLEALERSRQRA